MGESQFENLTTYAENRKFAKMGTNNGFPIRSLRKSMDQFLKERIGNPLLVPILENFRFSPRLFGLKN